MSISEVELRGLSDLDPEIMTPVNCDSSLDGLLWVERGSHDNVQDHSITATRHFVAHLTEAPKYKPQ